jgi:molybdenum-dependent DNA-binding transcriptional regulator ModE
MVQLRMLKTKAIELLGGSVSAAAKRIGISYQAVHKWPDVLPEAIADRVIAAVARKHLPPELIGTTPPGQTEQQAA